MKTNYTHKEILQHLVAMRATARYLVRSKLAIHDTIKAQESALSMAIKSGDTREQALCKIDLYESKERALELRFQIIETGNEFIGASGKYDELPRDAWLRAFSVNQAHWNTPDMVKYGGSVRNVIAVLNMENSATQPCSMQNRPLHWCCTMSMMHATHTNPALGETIHDAANQFFNGAFGAYQAPSIFERMGFNHV
jgi:hypothetical protein